MSTFTHLAEALKREENLTIEWAAPDEDSPFVSVEFANLEVVVSPKMGADGHFPLTDRLNLTPDAARLLGLALIEASGLALGAWGAKQGDEGRSNE